MAGQSVIFQEALGNTAMWMQFSLAQPGLEMPGPGIRAKALLS